VGDEIDRAQANDEFFRELALKAVERRASSDERGKTDERRDCVDCGSLIPAARRRAVPGCVRCVACQNEFEQIHTHWRAL
jgi:phage/conjugal plasmid C-4 type zinc finger TraR family protein